MADKVDVRKVFDAIAKIMGARYNVDVKVVAIHEKKRPSRITKRTPPKGGPGGQALYKEVIPMCKYDIPGPIWYMPQRTRHPWKIRKIVAAVMTVILWGLVFFLAGVAAVLYIR